MSQSSLESRSERLWPIEDVIDGLRVIAGRRGMNITRGDVLVVEEAARHLQAKSSEISSGEAHNDAFRINWLFASLNDEAITAKVKRAGAAYMMGARTGIGIGDFRAAIDQAIHEEQAEKDAAHG